MASAAVPVPLPIQSTSRGELFDGGIANNAPMSVAHSLGAHRIIVLPAGFPCATRRLPATAVAMLLHTFSLLVARQLATDAWRLRDACTLRVVPPLCPLRVVPYDLSQTASLMAQGADHTRRRLADGGMDRDEIPLTLMPHDHAGAP